MQDVCRTLDCVIMAEEAGKMGPFVDADGNRCSVEQVVRNLLKEDVTYEFIAHVAQCPLKTEKDIAAKEKSNRE